MASFQLQALGFTRPVIARRARDGHLHRLHRGVYAVGHTRLALHARWLAAVLACGPDAVPSHADAAALWDIRHVPTGPIHVTAPVRRTVPGLATHVSRIGPHDRLTIDGIPVTGLDRTIIDLAPGLHAQRLRTLLESAERRRVLDAGRLRSRLGAGRPGMPKLQGVLDELGPEPPRAHHGLEARFLELIRREGLPEPLVNHVVAGLEVDFHWPRERIVVELDSWDFHRGRRSFEEDRRRDAILLVAGWRVLRITARRLDAGLADLRTMLGA